MPNKQMTTIYVVRQGESVSNVEKIVAGHTDKPLTLNGEQQAQKQAKNLDSAKFDVVFASDLMRAKRTAEIIAEQRQLAVNTTHLLRERNFGEWEGRPASEFYEQNLHLIEKVKTLTEQEKRDSKFGVGYESSSEIALRFITFLREIVVTYSGKTVLVVSHGGIMRSLLMHLGFGTYDELPAGCIDNTGYFVLESDSIDFFIKETVGIHKLEI